MLAFETLFFKGLPYTNSFRIEFTDSAMGLVINSRKFKLQFHRDIIFSAVII